MGDSAGYVAFLLIGIVLVVVDGQLIYRSGRSYLGDVYRSSNAAAAANRLTATLFHLVVFGVLALFSTLDMPGNSLGQVVGRLGLFLLVLALAHAVTMGIYGWIRGRQQEAQISDQILEDRAERLHHREHREASYGIALDVPDERPYVAPPLDPPGPSS